MMVPRRETLILLLAVLGTPTDVHAENWIYFSPLQGELAAGFDSRWQRSDGNPDTRQLQYEEKLRLELSGYSLDPGIFNFNANVQPVLKQETSDMGADTVSTDSQFLNYGVRFDALSGVQASPFAIGANMARSSAEIDGSLGNRRDAITESRGADLRWKSAAFPTTLSYNERYLDEVFIPALGLPPLEREDFLRTVTLHGRSSKMDLFLQGNDFDDMSLLDQDYQSQDARLSNVFHWGKGSEFNSRLTYGNREGFSDYERVLVDESLRLQHTNNLFTTYRYGYEATRQTTDSETHRGAFELNHRLYSNLTTALSLRGSRTNADTYEDKDYDGNLDFYYFRKLPSGVRVSANLGGGYRVSERVGGRLDYTESPTVPITGIVLLTQRYIVWSTIVVTAPGCIPCLVGTDYFIEDAGGDFTQLRIPAGSRIAVGDIITVDYGYEPPSAEFYGIPYRIGARVDFGWVALYHSTSGENQTLVSGPDPNAVTDRRVDSTGIELNWADTQTQATASASRLYTWTEARETTEYVLGQTVNHTLAPRATLTLRLTESFLKDGSDVDAYSGDLAISWVPMPGLFISPHVSAFHRAVDPGGTEDYLRAGVDARWNWRLLAFDMRYDHTIRDNDSGNLVEDRLMVNATRKF